MSHLGKPISILILLAVATGLGVLARQAPIHAKFTVWVFTEDNAATYRHLTEGQSVRVDLIAQHALDARLASLFMSDSPTSAVPDLVEIDIGSVAKYFRAPVGEIGLLPLNGFLTDSGQINRILPARLIPWSKHGVIFGVPRDVHPVTLTYRKDLFDEAGINLQSAGNWEQFQQKCLEFQHYWINHGYPHRAALELYAAQSEELVLMLLQRHINLVDGENRIHLTDPFVAHTLAFYAQLVAGPRKIAADTMPGTPFGYRDLADGSVCAMLTPDWRAGYLKQYAPELSGKLRMMPLPKFEDSDAPTSTWGGTMIGIPRHAKDPAASWHLLQSLCLTHQAVIERRRYSVIIPPIKEFWNDPVFQSADPFYGGQAIDRLYIHLAGQIPTRYISPLSINAQAALTLVLNKAVGYVREHDGNAGLSDAVAGWLSNADAELNEWVAYGELDQ